MWRSRAITLGNLDSDQSLIKEGQKEYEEALKIYRELARKNPETYLADVAMILNNLGILDIAQNRMKEARIEYEEALKTYAELAQKDPGTYLPNVAMMLNNLDSGSRPEQMAEARKEYEEALKIYEAFAKQDPEQLAKFREGAAKDEIDDAIRKIVCN
jgi:tetratricopeptide (TPR) repeat protein